MDLDYHAANIYLIVPDHQGGALAKTSEMICVGLIEPQRLEPEIEVGTCSPILTIYQMDYTAIAHTAH